ncbi:MAG: AMP-binding protein, partial [Acidobacteriota bacterium]
MTGVLWAGGAFLPLDPRDPPDRIALLLEDARPAAVLAPPDAAYEVPPGVARLVLGSGGDEPGPGDSPAPAQVPAEALAYLLYTSGSSGRPKGVMVSHRALSRYLAWAEEELLRGAPVPLLSRSSFDASLKQLLLPLAEGRPVVVPEAGLDRPAVLAEVLARFPGGVVNCVPAAWEAFLEAVEQGDAPLPAGLARVLLGGDELAESLVERTRRLLPTAELVNLYGPTEATANAAAGRLRPGAPVSLGTAAAGARLYVLDPRGRPVPLGVDGELAIGGATLARGYLGLPAATAERFVPDAWGGRPGGRLYRTGDLVRRLADGALRFRGRFDRQVEVRGHRVEL